MVTEFRTPALIRFGQDTSQQIGENIKALNGTHVLVISDKIIEQTGIVSKIIAPLKPMGISHTLYLDVEAEPSIDNLGSCRQAAKDCNLVLGIGGGSVLDVAKTVAALCGNDQEARAYLGVGLLPHRGIPCILVPTNAGTGSEVSPNALFYIPEDKEKKAIVSPYLFPDVAVIDPMLTLSVPPRITAHTGIDALCHALESYTSVRASRWNEIYAVESIRLIGGNLRTAYQDGSDVQARTALAQASCFAGISMSNAGSHAVHALGYPLQGLYRIPHGLACSMMLAPVVAYIAMSNIPKFALATALLGEDTTGMDEREAAQRCTDTCRKLCADLGIPTSLKEFGIQASDVDALTQGTLRQTRVLKNCPMPLSERDIREIFSSMV